MAIAFRVTSPSRAQRWTGFTRSGISSSKSGTNTKSSARWLAGFEHDREVHLRRAQEGQLAVVIARFDFHPYIAESAPEIRA